MTLSQYLFAFALSVITYLSPVTWRHEAVPGWAETPGERLSRYNLIAYDVARAALDACQKHAKPRVCARWYINVALAIAHHESDFAPDVDAGKCYRGKDGKSLRCDSGNAHSIWQVHPMEPGDGARFDNSRYEAVRAAMGIVVRSLHECRLRPKEDQYAVYAGGGCQYRMAVIRSQELYRYIERAKKAPHAWEDLVWKEQGEK